MKTRTCGVRVDGPVACWGEGGTWRRPLRIRQSQLWSQNRWILGMLGQRRLRSIVAPAGTFRSLSAGIQHACGVRADGRVVCWGNDFYRQSSPPDGTFTSVSAGSDYTCGIRTDGAVVCWGNDDVGQSSPPVGAFTSVSASRATLAVCGTDGSLACWGSDHSGHASPPAGSFTSVSGTCGVRTDGPIACWGDNPYNAVTSRRLLHFSQWHLRRADGRLHRMPGVRTSTARTRRLSDHSLP